MYRTHAHIWQQAKSRYVRSNYTDAFSTLWMSVWCNADADWGEPCYCWAWSGRRKIEGRMGGWMDGWTIKAGERWERGRDFDVLPLSCCENNIILPMGCCKITQSQWKMTGELRFPISTWQPWWSNHNLLYPFSPPSLWPSLLQPITFIPILHISPASSPLISS